jgi:hypothetical protein
MTYAVTRTVMLYTRHKNIYQVECFIEHTGTNFLRKYRNKKVAAFFDVRSDGLNATAKRWTS